jgi:hypothetical protein
LNSFNNLAADRGLLVKEAEAKGMSISSYLLNCWKKEKIKFAKNKT